MANKSKVVVRDRGFLETTKELNLLDDLWVSVGIHAAEDGERDEGGNVEIATFHEFGLGVPERSFLRTTMDERRGDIARLMTKALNRVGSISAKDALSILGQFVENAVKAKITSLNEPPNAPSTIAKKGSSNPLVDTGQMKNSVTHRVGTGRRPRGAV